MATLTIQGINQNEKDEIIKSAKMMVEAIEEKSNQSQIIESLKQGINKKLIDFKSIKFGGELAGYFHLGLSEKYENSIEIYFLYVFESYRRNGVGQHIIEHAIYQSYAKQKKLMIEVSERNKYAIRWLAEFNIKQIGVENGMVIFEFVPPPRKD